MRWYPVAHLAAVTMSSSAQSFKHCSCCFRTPLVRLLGLCPHSCYTSFNFRTRDVGLWCRFQTTEIIFNDVEGGSISCVLIGGGGGGMAKSRLAGTPSYPKTSDLWGSIFSSPVPEKNNRHSIHYPSSCQEKQLIGGIAMVIVKFRPRWPHT